MGNRAVIAINKARETEDQTEIVALGIKCYTSLCHIPHDSSFLSIAIKKNNSVCFILK